MQTIGVGLVVVLEGVRCGCGGPFLINGSWTTVESRDPARDNTKALEVDGATCMWWLKELVLPASDYASFIANHGVKIRLDRAYLAPPPSG